MLLHTAGDVPPAGLGRPCRACGFSLDAPPDPRRAREAVKGKKRPRAVGLGAQPSLAWFAPYASDSLGAVAAAPRQSYGAAAAIQGGTGGGLKQGASGPRGWWGGWPCRVNFVRLAPVDGGVVRLGGCGRRAVTTHADHWAIQERGVPCLSKPGSALPPPWIAPARRRRRSCGSRGGSAC